MSSQKSSRFPRSRAAAVRNRVPGKHERGRVLPWSALAAAVFGIAITLAFSLQSASQSQAVGTDEITIASSAANTNVPLATNFTVTLSVTTSTALYKSIQWELAYGANIGFVSAVYNCSGAPISFPSETETAPTEGNASDLGVPLAPLKILGSGANCASLSAAYAGSNALATFVTVTLQCLSNGATSVFAVDATAASDPNFGTSLGDKNGSNIPTTLSPTFNAGTFGTRAGFNITCGAASATNTPVPATNTPTNTPIPANTSTSTTTATATNTVAGPTNTPPRSRPTRRRTRRHRSRAAPAGPISHSASSPQTRCRCWP